MGQAVSTTVYVHLDNDAFIAGSVVSGSIFMHVSDLLHIEGLQIQICGHEYASWRDSKASHPPETVILQFSVPVLGPGTLQPGQYQLPFQCHLPQHIPGSFHYADPVTQTRGRISYGVHAHLACVTRQQDAHHCTPMKVLQPVSPPQGLVEERQQVIKRLACMSQGTIAAKLELSSHATPGHPFPLQVHMTNSSHVPVTVISAYISYRIRLRSGPCKHKVGPWYQTKCRSRAAANGWSLLPGSSACVDLVLHIPEDSSPTRNGTSIVTSYKLTVTLMTPLTYSNIQFKVPITMNDKQSVVMGVPLPDAPPGWGVPLVYPTFQFGASAGAPVPPPHPLDPREPALGQPSGAMRSHALDGSVHSRADPGDHSMLSSSSADNLVNVSMTAAVPVPAGQRHGTSPCATNTSPSAATPAAAGPNHRWVDPGYA